MQVNTTFAIANQKGGEGKTTTALNLSHGLAINSYKTLLIDMDPQANSTGVFLDHENKAPTISDIFLRKQNIDQVIQTTKYENLSLLPSKINLAEVEFSSLNIEAPYILRDALNKMKKAFDFIVIDCPPSLSILTINALVASQYVIIPLQAEKFSVDGIRGLQNTIESIKRRINPNLQILGALVTQLKSNTILTKTILPIIEKYFPVFQNSISVGVAIGESHLSRETILGYNKKIKQAKEYLLFTNEVISGIKN